MLKKALRHCTPPFYAAIVRLKSVRALAKTRTTSPPPPSPPPPPSVTNTPPLPLQCIAFYGVETPKTQLLEKALYAASSSCDRSINPPFPLSPLFFCGIPFFSRQLLEKALYAAFLSCDRAVKVDQDASKDEDHSGSTAVAAFITPTHFVLAHAGDSRAVLASGKKVGCVFWG